ncbi:MAG: hypothetical protein ACKO13_08995 [Cytophagales bacterium]
MMAQLFPQLGSFVINLKLLVVCTQDIVKVIHLFVGEHRLLKKCPSNKYLARIEPYLLKPDV